MKNRLLLIALIGSLSALAVVFISRSQKDTGEISETVSVISEEVESEETENYASTTEYDILDIPDIISEDECLQLLEDYYSDNSETAENAKQRLKGAYEFLGIDSEGFGACLFTCHDWGMSSATYKLCKTDNYGKTWTFADKNYTVASGDKEYAVFDKTFFIFDFTAFSYSLRIYSVDLAHGETSEEYCLYPEGITEDVILKTSYNVKTVVDSVGENSITIKLGAYSEDRKLNYKPTEDEIFYIAEYDSSLKIIKEIYRDDDLIDKIINN